MILTAITNGTKRRTLQLRVNQSARIGHSDWADFTIAEDPNLAELHFNVSCTTEGCQITPLAPDGETSVNQEPISSTSIIRDGDVIAAGNTVFHVSQLDQPERAEETSEESVGAEMPAALTPLALCQYLDFDEDVQELAHALDSHEMLIERLAQEELLLEALQVQAYDLANRVTVWWGIQCLEHLSTNWPEAQQSALNAAVDWVAEPNESRRRFAESQAKAVEGEGSGGYLAYAAFASEGSFAPVSAPFLETDDRVTGKAVVAALSLAAYEAEDGKAEERLMRYLAQGQQIARGKIVPPWEE